MDAKLSQAAGQLYRRYVLLFLCRLLLSSEWISLVEGVWVWACFESPLMGDATESMIILAKGS